MALLKDQYDKVLLEDVAPNIHDIIREKMFFGNYVVDAPSGVKFKGNTTEVRMKTQYEHSYQPAKEMETIPKPGTPDWIKFLLTVRKCVGTLAFSQEAVEHTAGDSYQVGALKSGLETFMKTMRLTKELLIASDGTGAILGGDCTGPAVGQNIPVTHSFFIRRGMRVMAVDGSDNVVAPELFVTKENPDTHDVTVTGDVSGIDGTCQLYLFGGYSPAHDKSPMGFDIHLSDTNGEHALYQGFDRSTDYILSGRNLYGSVKGTPENISEARVYDLFALFRDVDRDEKRSGICNDGVAKHLLAYRATKNQPTVRFDQEIGDKKGIRIIHNGETIEIEVHPVIPQNQLWAIHKGSNVWYRGKAGFYNPSGAKEIFRAFTDQLGMYAVWADFWNIVSLDPMLSGKMHDITEA